MELLEKLVSIIDCMYISNLHHQYILSAKQINLIEKINIENYSLKEWQETINYIMGYNKEIVSASEAKKLLLDYYKRNLIR